MIACSVERSSSPWPSSSSASAAARAGASGSAPSGADSVFARARQLVVNGNGAAGRVLVDSMVAVTTPDTPAYAEALYWRATLAATSADAERDYPARRRRVPAVAAHGRRAARSSRSSRSRAAIVLRRSRTFSVSCSRIRGAPSELAPALLLVRLAFEQNDAQLGCTILGRIAARSAGERRSSFAISSRTTRRAAPASTRRSSRRWPRPPVARDCD